MPSNCTENDGEPPHWVKPNLGAHRSKRVRELIEGRGCELLYLPPYSPDYNLIEEAFSKIKNLLCAGLRPGAKRPW